MANALLDPWNGPLGTPDFASFEAEDFLPSFQIALAENAAEIEVIAARHEEPGFDNVIAALERAGSRLARVRRLFWTLSSAQSSSALRAIEPQVSDMLSKHANAINHDPRLFARVAEVYDTRNASGLTSEQIRLTEVSYNGFIKSGARLDPVAKARFAEVDQRLGQLSITFGQNVMAATNAWSMALEEADLAGLPAPVRSAASARATAKGAAGQYIFTLDRTDFEAFLAYSERRDLRETLWRAFTSRCVDGPFDNSPVIVEILKLRHELATIMGYSSYAHYALEDSMAGGPDAAGQILHHLWGPAIVKASFERDALQALADADGKTFSIEPWDWPYYAEKLRASAYQMDGAALSSHLKLKAVRQAAFDAANGLFGLSFRQRTDISCYHPNVDAWEVCAAGSQPLGTLFTDYLARTEKHGGAWMGSLKVQEKLDGDVKPVVYLVANFAEPPEGQDARLSLGEARTLFHEFGHALHGLLSDVTYPSLAGTAVARDFVEFPSKLLEHWITDPDTLMKLGVPEKLAYAVQRTETFGQGFATVELVASALADLSLHSLPPTGEPERDVDVLLQKLGMPTAIGMRHRLSYFTHIFDGGYAGAYYSYLWSEMLDADAFGAFLEAGNRFDRATADRLRNEVLARGNSRDPMESFVAFRGRTPNEAALLESRGLAHA